MKKYIDQLLCSLFIGGTMVACTEDYMETDKGHDTLTLSVNQQELVLNEKNHSQEALALSWTTGTNYGSDNRISYTLELAEAGTDFANAYSVDLGPGTYQWTKKGEELNQFLNTQLGIGYAVKAELEARITAVVAGMEDQKQNQWKDRQRADQPVRQHPRSSRHKRHLGKHHEELGTGIQKGSPLFTARIKLFLHYAIPAFLKCRKSMRFPSIPPITPQRKQITRSTGQSQSGVSAFNFST